MDDVPGANRFAPPAAHVDDIAIGGEGALAGRGTRLLAIIIDGLLGVAAFWIVSRLTPFNIFGFDPNVTPSANPMLQVSPLRLAETVVISLAIFLLLHGYLLQTRGQSIGKLAMNIRIVRTDGSRASLVRLAGLRYLVSTALTLIPLAGWVYGLVDPLLIFRTSRKCLHDNIADTIVVKA